MSILRPCKTSAAFEAIPEDDLGLDLDAVESRLVDDGWRTVANARVLLVVAKDLEATVFPSGKVLIKTTERPEAERVWGAIRGHLGVEEAAYES